MLVTSDKQAVSKFLNQQGATNLEWVDVDTDYALFDRQIDTNAPCMVFDCVAPYNHYCVVGERGYPTCDYIGGSRYRVVFQGVLTPSGVLMMDSVLVGTLAIPEDGSLPSDTTELRILQHQRDVQSILTRHPHLQYSKTFVCRYRDESLGFSTVLQGITNEETT